MERELTVAEKSAEESVNEGLEARRRADNCLIDIKNALKKWNCQLDPIVQLGPGDQIRKSYGIVPLIRREVQ